MLLSYAKPFNEKMRKQLVKAKNMLAIFQQFQSIILKKKEKIWFGGGGDKNTQQQPKHNNIYTIGLKACDSIKKRLQHRCFKNTFSYGTTPVDASDSW